MHQHLPSINLLHVESISNGWSVTFQATSGRLSGDAKGVVRRWRKVIGHSKLWWFQSSRQTNFWGKRFDIRLGLCIQSGACECYRWWHLELCFNCHSCTCWCSASITTATGSALSLGIAGSIQGEQVVTFLPWLSDPTENLCGSCEKFRRGWRPCVARWNILTFWS